MSEIAKPYRVIATGGRNHTGQSLIWRTWDEIGAEHPNLLVVQGACYPPQMRGHREPKSADWLTHLWCLSRGVPDEPHPAEWTKCSALCPDKPHRRRRWDGSEECPLAGPARNQLMVDLGAALTVAYPASSSRGTWDCVRRAKAAGIEIRVIKP